MTNKLTEIEMMLLNESLEFFERQATNQMRQTNYRKDGSQAPYWEADDVVIYATHPAETMLTRQNEAGRLQALIRGTAFSREGSSVTVYVIATEGFNGYDEPDVRHMILEGYTTFKEAYKKWGE